MKWRLTGKNQISKIVLGTLACCLSLFVIARFFYLIDLYSVNILFYDNWDFYSVLMSKHSLWQVFSWQYAGPCRAGLGFIFTEVIAKLSGWNIRAETFASGIIVFLAMLLALGLKKRLFKSFSWTDVAIPLMFFTPLQYEFFVNTPNLSHGPVPLLLIIIYCLCLTLPALIPRYLAILATNFLLIYTSFGLFMGAVTPLIFLFEWQSLHRRGSKNESLALLALFASLISLGSFFIGFTFNPAVDNFHFPSSSFGNYVKFIFSLLASYLGIRGSPWIDIFWGYLFSFSLVGLVIFYGWRVIKNPADAKENEQAKNFGLIMVSLALFILIFSVAAAVGRISLGVSPRYIPYLTPAFLAFYLCLLTVKNKSQRILFLTALIILLIMPTLFFNKFYRQWAIDFSQKKKQWKETYLLTEDIKQTDRQTNFWIYPYPEATDLQGKLEYLKAHKLNLYLDR